MGLRLQPRDSTFFSLFATAGQNVGNTVELLREFVNAPQDRRAELAARVHESEHAGDNTTHDIIARLDRSFITPFDREDIYRLAVRLDDVIDYLDAAVDFTTLYHVGELPEAVHSQVALLGRCASRTTEAMSALAKPQSLTQYWVEINELENEADQVYRRTLTWLFSGELDPLTVMKLKEIVDSLEQAADAFEHVADVVHTIAVKES